MHDDPRGTEHDLETDASPDRIDEFDLDIQLFPGPAAHRIEAARTVVGTNCDTCMDPSETCQGNTCGRTCHTHCGSCGCVDSDHSCRGCPSFETNCMTCQDTRCQTCVGGCTRPA